MAGCEFRAVRQFVISAGDMAYNTEQYGRDDVAQQLRHIAGVVCDIAAQQCDMIQCADLAQLRLDYLTQ